MHEQEKVTFNGVNILSYKYKLTDHARIERERGGGAVDPPENHQNIGFF